MVEELAVEGLWVEGFGAERQLSRVSGFGVRG